MTLIATILNDDGSKIICLSDTRISAAQRPIVDNFTKQFILNVSWTNDGPKEVKSFVQLGFAFAGSTLGATAFYAICNNMLSNLNGSGTAAAPSFEVISSIMHDIHKEIFEIYRASQQEVLKFEVDVFGYCPISKRPMISTFFLRKGADALLYPALHIEALKKNKPMVLGSGKKAFMDKWFYDFVLGRVDSINFERAFVDTVRGGDDPATGGSIQYLEISQSSARMLPFAVASDDLTDLIPSIGGIDVRNISMRGTYSVGVEVAAFQAEEVFQKLIDSGNSGSAEPLSSRVQVSFEAVLRIAEESERRIHFKGRQVHVSGPVLAGAGVYYSSSCENCGGTIFLAKGNPRLVDFRPFHGEGGIHVECTSCNCMQVIVPNEVVSTRVEPQ